MKTMAALTGLVLLAAGITLQAQTNPNKPQGQLSEKDYHFVENAARGGMTEVQMGQLAQQKGISPTVRSFGARMVTDHTKINDELKQIAAKKGATLPAQLSHGEKSDLEKLQKETGTDFDKTYAHFMVRDHKEDVKEFEKAAKDLEDPDLKAFAQKTLPVLQQHLQLAEQMEAAVKKEK
jgi:putative membrane protein